MFVKTTVAVRSATNNFNYFSCNVSELTVGEDNLIIKALALIERELEVKIEGYIELEKNIPIGAGLGGGSSDAAATLKSLNYIFKSSLSLDKINNMAASLGSDVPFFVNSKPTICKGRGDELIFYSGGILLSQHSKLPVFLNKDESYGTHTTI